MPTAFGYIRVSSERQVTDGVSLDVQEQQLVSLHATAYKASYTWGGIVRDAAVSARLEDFSAREGGGKLLLKVQRGDCIIFHSVSRAFRTMRDAVNTMHGLEQRGIRVVFLDMGGQPVDMASISGQWLFHILAMASQMEVQQLRTRISAAKDYLRAEGRAATQYPAFTLTYYKVGSGKGRHLYVVPDIKKRRVCEFIMRSKRNGHSCEAISQYMNEHKIPPITRGRIAWDAKCVSNIYDKFTLRRKQEIAAGEEQGIAVDGETTVLMPNGEVWTLDDFIPKVAGYIRGCIKVANTVWGVRNSGVDKVESDEHSEPSQTQEACNAEDHVATETDFHAN